MISRPAQVYWADRLTTNRFHHHLLQPLVVGAWVAVVALGFRFSPRSCGGTRRGESAAKSGGRHGFATVPPHLV